MAIYLVYKNGMKEKINNKDNLLPHKIRQLYFDKYLTIDNKKVYIQYIDFEGEE